MKRFAGRFRNLSLSKRLTFLVMIALTIACIVLTAAMSVAGDQMVYTIYTTQTTVTQGVDGYNLPTVSKSSPGSGTILLPEEGLESPFPPRADQAARLKYRTESIVYVICTVAVAGIATFMITENCLQPLVCLRDQVVGLNAQTLSSPVEPPAPQTGDEIASLTSAFSGMRRRLDGSFEAQKRFSANAAHELRTPLAAIQTKLDVFSKRDSHTEEEYAALIATVGKQTSRLSLLVKDLLDLSCTDAIPERERLALRPLLEEMLQDLAPLAQERSMTLTVSGEGETAGSERLLTRAIFNLVENALKYGRPGGHVWLMLHTDQGQTTLVVEDDGAGIPAECRDQIFEPFYRVDKSRSRAMGGAGLGLPMSRAILERHGGRLEAAERPGGGARFSITLPAA